MPDIRAYDYGQNPPGHCTYHCLLQLPLVFILAVGGTLLQDVLLSELLKQALLPGHPHAGQSCHSNASKS